MQAKMMKIFDIGGLVILLGIASATAFSFFTAYLHPSRQVLIDINSFGEADFEAVFLGVASLWGLVAFVRIIWRLK